VSEGQCLVPAAVGIWVSSVCCSRSWRVVWFAGEAWHDDAAACCDVASSDAETSAAAADDTAATGVRRCCHTVRSFVYLVIWRRCSFTSFFHLKKSVWQSRNNREECGTSTVYRWLMQNAAKVLVHKSWFCYSTLCLKTNWAITLLNYFNKYGTIANNFWHGQSSRSLRALCV